MTIPLPPEAWYPRWHKWLDSNDADPKLLAASRRIGRTLAEPPSRRGGEG